MKSLFNKLFTHQTAIQKKDCKNLAQSLRKIKIPSHWNLEVNSTGHLLLHTGEGQPFSLVFSSLYPPLKNQPFIKAIGFKSKPLDVLDVTAGWGKDAFLLAELGCSVLGLERHELVFAFLQQAQSQVETKGLLQFVLGDSLSYVKKIIKKPDVIYLDPFFTEEKKSLSRKSLRILQELALKEGESYEDLFQNCLKKAKKRIVVKRHKLQKSMPGNLLCTFFGRSVCFDVFAPVTIKKGG